MGGRIKTQHGGQRPIRSRDVNNERTLLPTNMTKSITIMLAT